MTVRPRTLELILGNRGIPRQVDRLLRETAGDEVVIPMRIHRHVSRGNRAFAVTVLSEHISFAQETVTPEASTNLPGHAVPGLTEGDRGAMQMATTMGMEFIFLIDVSGILSAVVSAAQMCAAILNFRGRHVPYAYRRGFWYVVFWEPPQDRDRNVANALGSSSGANRQQAIEAYRNGYRDGTNVREDFLNDIWQRVYDSRNNYDSATRDAIVRLSRAGPGNLRARRVAVTSALRHRYPWYSADLQQLIRYPWR